MLLTVVAAPMLAQPCVWQQADSVAVVTLLQQAAGQPAADLPLFFAHKLEGKPYVAHTLEGQAAEQLVVNLRQFDCTTLVENVTALTLCAQRGQTAFSDFCTMLQQLRYRNDSMDGYASRLHYFTDWILSNEAAGRVEEIQSDKAPFTAVQRIRVDYMSKHPQQYEALRAHPEEVKAIAAQEQSLTGRTFRYVPSGQATDEQALREVVANGDIIAFVTNKKGLDIAHVGLAVWKVDGLHFIHASSVHGRVVLEPVTIARYLEKHPSFPGIRIVRIKSNRKPIK